MVIRADLPKGIQAANLVHAAGESSPGALPDGTHAVVLAVPNESALHAVRARLQFARVAHVAIVETDAPYEGQLMAIGLCPDRKENVRRFVASLPLLR